MINSIKISKMPKIWFAHKFYATDYSCDIELYKNTMEITYFKEGTAILTTKNGAKHVFNKGQVAVNKGDYYIHVKSNGYHEHITFSFFFDAEENDDDSIVFNYLNVITNKEITDKIADLIEKIIIEYSIYQTTNANCILYIFQVLKLLDSSTKSSFDKTPSSVLYVEKIKRYINTHIDGHISLDDLSNEIKLSNQYMCNIFKEITNESIIQYINRVKLDKIKVLVEFKGLTIEQAGDIYGIHDKNYISRMFKKYYGHTLSELKKIGTYNINKKI